VLEDANEVTEAAQTLGSQTKTAAFSDLKQTDAVSKKAYCAVREISNAA